MSDRRPNSAEPTNPQTDKPGNGGAGAGAYSYRNLDVWNRAQELATAVIRLARTLPRDPSRDVVIRQLVACAASVGANIAEGHARFSYAAYRNHLNIARGSASEVGSWLDLLKRTGDITEEDERRLGTEADSIAGLLRHKIRKLTEAESAAKARRIGEPTATYTTSSEGEELQHFDLSDDEFSTERVQ